MKISEVEKGIVKISISSVVCHGAKQKQSQVQIVLQQGKKPQILFQDRKLNKAKTNHSGRILTVVISTSYC